VGGETFLIGVAHEGQSISIDNPSHGGLANKVTRQSRTARCRLNWIHQASAKLASQFALFATEELSIQT